MSKSILGLVFACAASVAAMATPATAAPKPTRIWTNQTDRSQVFPTITGPNATYEIKFNIFSSTMGSGSTITGIRHKFGN